MFKEPPIAANRDVDSEAEQELWEQYYTRLVALARAKLGSFPTAVEDENDIAVSAIKSFFRRAKLGKFPDLQEQTELWPLLVQITVWKIHNLRRRHLTKGRDVRRSISLDLLRDNAPTAEIAAKVIDEGNDLLESLDDEKLRSVAELKLQEYTNAEIAERIGRTEKTVEWRLKQVRKRLLAEMENYDG